MKSKFLFGVIFLIAAMNLFAFDFAVECLSTSINVIQGFGGITSVHLALISGPPQTVKMTATNLPAGISVSFSPSDIPFDNEGGHPPYTSTAAVRIIASASAPLGTHTITLTGTGGGLTRTTTLNLQVAPLSAKGKIYYVSASGNDGSAGTSAQPFRTIQHAADISMPGDVLVVKAGEYRERIRIKTSGLPGSPITFLGEPGAVINGADKITGWEPAPEIATGVYKKPVSAMPFDAKALTYQGKYCVWLLEHATNGLGPALTILKNQVQSGFITSSGPLSYLHLTGAHGYTDRVANISYVRLKSGGDPDNEDIEFAPTVPAFDIDGKNCIVVSGFTIRNSWTQVSIANSATGNIIEYCTILGGNYGIHIWGDAANTHIRNNEITLDFYYNDHGHPLNASVIETYMYMLLRNYTWSRGNWEYSKHYSIAVDDAQGTHIYENHIFRTFSGVVVDDPSFQANQLRIFQNYFHHIDGYWIEFHGMGDSTWINDNLLYESSSGVRIDIIPNTSALYIYRNRFGLLSHTGDPDAYGHKSEANSNSIEVNCATNGKVCIYHNSFSARTSIVWGTAEVPDTWVVNNIFSPVNAGFFVIWTIGNPSFHIDYNWIGGSNATGYLSAIGNSNGGHNRLYEGQAIWDIVNASYLIPATSPGVYARRSGIDLSKPWIVSGVQNPALPGMVPGYFSGSTPDVGAIQYGAPSIRESENERVQEKSNAIQISSRMHPMQRSLILQYSIPEPAMIQLGVYNHLGQCIRHLETGEKMQGEHKIEWDQTDDNGNKISNGLYFLQLKISNQESIHQILAIF